MHIDVIVNNAEASLTRKSKIKLKKKKILIQARRWVSKPFLSETPTRKSKWWLFPILQFLSMN